LRLVGAEKLELESSMQLLFARLPELSVERTYCRPWHRDPSALQTAFNLDDVVLCQAVEHHSEVNHRSYPTPLLVFPPSWPVAALAKIS